MSLIDKISEVESQCLAAISGCHNENELTEVEIKFLSKKGLLSECLKALRDVAPSERPVVGQKANETKTRLESALSEKKSEFQNLQLGKKLQSERIDVTLPARISPMGSIHPISRVVTEIASIFRRLGFDLSEGPEVDTEFHCFDALNIGPDHPARDMQDTFYLKATNVKDRVVLRTQTSTVQIRTMLEKKKPPVRILSPGAVFRSDYDQTHSPMFHQVEGLYVDSHVSFAELKGCLQFFAREMFGSDAKIRLRPSFFPFVEPGAEVDVWFKDKNHPHGGRWLEILGAGMVHPNVFKAVGFDPESVSGFAFGMGVERVAMLKYGINDLRLLFENDVRFLRQFTGL